jgi:phage minor structural protein
MIYLTEGNTPLNEAYNDEIVQERNNTYQLTFRFPTSDPKWELLKEETFLTADDLHGEQDFYIFEVEKQQGYIQVYANQVISLLNNYIISSIDVDRVSGTRVLSALAGSITRTNPFSFFSDIDDRHTLNIKDKNAMEVLAKDKHSILGQWGGDMVRNGYNLRLLKNGGSENESLFMYKKNLSSYQHKTSTKSLKTRITFKTTVKGEGEKAPDVDYVVVIDSPLLGKYSQIYEAVVEVNDQNVKDQASLIEYGKQYFRTSMCDMLEDNLEISVVGQSDVAVRMFDVVSIYHEWYGLDVRKKITKYTYSPMAKHLKSIGFGTFQSSLANAIGGIVNDAVLNESRNLHQIFDERLKKEIANADRAFDAEFAKREKAITDSIELAKAKAEEVKQELSDTINQRFNSFDNGPLKEAKRKAEEALKNAGASSSLAQEAKQIGLDSIARLEAFKSQTTTTQTALSGDLDALKRTITNDIRPKQAQAKVEIAKQVEALNKTKNELVGVKSAQATYEETTTRRLAELTNLANGKASKSELTQTAEELKSRIATVQVGGRNYIRGTRRMALANGLWTSGTFRPSGLGTTKTINVSDSPATGFDKAIRLTSSDARYQIGIAQDEFEIMPGTYTMSVWVKGSVGQRVRLQTYWAPDDATGISPYFILKDDKWTYLTFSSERKKAGKLSIGYVYLLGADAGEYLDVLAPQLENGTLATSPKEAPEDTDGQISAVESTFKQRADSLDAGVRSLTEGLRTKADISSLNVTAENIRQSVKRLETDTQNKLNQKLNQAEFEVQAGSIRQEILNATKDKADKTLVVAEAGKLREEFSKIKVGSRNYAEDYDFSRGLWYYTQGDNSPQDWTISNGEYNVKGTTNTWKQMQIYSKEGSITSGKSSTALLDLEIGETYTLSFQGICYSGSSSVWLSLRANRTVSGYPEIMHGNFNLTSSWQTYQVTIPALTKPENFDFWRIILGYNEVGHVAFRKVELTRSSTRIDAGPAPEDGKMDLIAAKSEFEKTAEGLSMKLAAVESYVGQDSQRQEALQRYTREESARQATAVREQIFRDYVGKSAYQEDVRGLERRFSAISTQTSNDIASKIAQYKQTVDGQFSSITSQIAGKANQTDFQRVRETSQLYERIIGSNENDISNKVAHIAMTNQLFQVEVSKNEGLKTVQRQLAGSWAVQNINSAGDIISGINLGANGHNRLDGKLTHITGETLIDNAVIKSAMIDKLKTANFEAGSVTTTILDAEAVTAEKLKVDNALIRKITANEAFIDQLTSKRIFATRIESVISSSTVLEGYKGWIGGFQLGTHDSGYGRWITGRNHFSVGMGNGEGGSGQTALWVNWGDNWNEPGYYAWFVKNNGRMHCKNTAEFWKTPIIHGDLKVTGKIFYDNRENGGRAGNWVYSEEYSKIDPDDGYLYLYYNSSGYNWIPMNKEISDRRYKSNIQDSQVSGLDVIENLKTYSYRKKYDGKVEDISCGIMAQDVQKYAPEAFFENPDGVYSYRTFALVPYLIKAIQELNQKIEKMEKTIA